MTPDSARWRFQRLGGLPKPTALGVARRSVRWGVAFARCAVEVALDRLRGDASEAALGRRFRELFKRVGGTAIKVGQQLSVRADLLPQAVCEALADLNDRVQPMPLAQALEAIGEGLGRPHDEIFAHVEPEPIGSASVACVYLGRLLDGQEVAIKVQRPGVAQAFANDLAAFNAMSRFMEWSTFVRADSFTALRTDLQIMFGEEMDFRLESRYQRLFSKFVVDAGLPWVRAPKVHAEHVCRTVLVMEFVQAISAGRVIEAVESRDADALAQLEARGITPWELAIRTQLLAAWARFEAPFFHADPHPGNVFIADGNQIILIDFGACGMTSRRTRRNHTQVMRASLQDDVSYMTNIMSSDTSPLPHLDVPDFKRQMQDRIALVFLAIADDRADWPERVMSSLWLVMLENARKLQLRMNLDTVRAIRAFLLYDTLSFRIAPTLSMEAIEQYLVDREQRQAKQAIADLREMPLRERARYASARNRDLIARLERMAAQVELALVTTTQTLQLTLSQGARWAQMGMRLFLFVSLIASLTFALQALRLTAPGALSGLGVAELVGAAIIALLVTGYKGRFSLGRVKARW